MLDHIDKKLLSLMQGDFPLTSEPFSALGDRLGIGGEEVLHRVERLKRDGIIRQVGPVLDARGLGYRTTLVAMQVPQSRLAETAQIINQHPGVSHNYAREHQFNLWFTLAVPSGVDIQEELERLNSQIGAEAVLNLPALRVFKLRAVFLLADIGQSEHDGEGDYIPISPQALSALDRAIINELQQELLLIPRPFDSMAARLGIDVNEFLERCRALQERGIIRRFGAAIRHNEVGFTANAMACWAAPPAMVEAAGREVASLPEVSHCYERKTSPLWPYNLFAMIHGHAKEDCQEAADGVSRETGLEEYVLLFTVKEFKKTRVRYLV